SNRASAPGSRAAPHEGPGPGSQATARRPQPDRALAHLRATELADGPPAPPATLASRAANSSTFERPLAASGAARSASSLANDRPAPESSGCGVLVASRSAAARRLLRPC